MPYTWTNNYTEKIITCGIEGLDFIKLLEEVSAADIGEENFQSIINLIEQINSAKKEWEKKRRQ
jgi:hypothetical protein